MSIQNTLSFLDELRQNNNRAWFQEHKSKYDEALAEFEDFLRVVIADLSRIDSSFSFVEPKECIYRIYRDVRFSRDKTPYEPSFRAHVAEHGRKSISTGVYISLTPGSSFLGGGVHSMTPEVTRLVRDSIASNDKKFYNIVKALDFTIEGEKLKSVPKGYDDNLLSAEYLKHKSWLVMKPLSKESLKSYDGLRVAVVDFFQKIQPLYMFFNNAIRDLNN